jgi:hypothetical protein
MSSIDATITKILAYLTTNIDDILVNYISSASAFLLGALASGIPILWLRFRNNRQLKYFGGQQRITIFVGTLLSGRRDKYSISRSDYYSTVFLFNFLKSISRKKQVELVDANNLDDSTTLTGSLVLIGGPNTNEASRKILSALEKVAKLPFSYTDTSISVGDMTFRLACDIAGGTEDTFGLIYKFPNPLSDEQPVVFVGGLSGFGTLSAARILADVILFKKAARVLRADSSLVVVRGCYINDKMISSSIVLATKIQ